ncbi:hypothetical protein LINPERPRIM_LOCUS2442 [Linum perenne]
MLPVALFHISAPGGVNALISSVNLVVVLKPSGVRVS